MAEHRADQVVKELGIAKQKPRKNEELYNGSSKFLVEMNLCNASRPLDHLMSKVSKVLLANEPAASDKKNINSARRTVTTRQTKYSVQREFVIDEGTERN